MRLRFRIPMVLHDMMLSRGFQDATRVGETPLSSSGVTLTLRFRHDRQIAVLTIHSLRDCLRCAFLGRRR